eukprot:TRINITY_DN17867_c0_g1_i1.p1 TRINITY_DN17867_c0_g1~~TRINITY_DN17867_c0_g1_i1.p1  ORF type:complete len:547 (+),score=167.95 TRINITY_DN17867_c0_g1_i1:66-1706(+)
MAGSKRRRGALQQESAEELAALWADHEQFRELEESGWQQQQQQQQPMAFVPAGAVPDVASDAASAAAGWLLAAGALAASAGLHGPLPAPAAAVQQQHAAEPPAAAAAPAAGCAGAGAKRPRRAIDEIAGKLRAPAAASPLQPRPPPPVPRSQPASRPPLPGPEEDGAGSGRAARGEAGAAAGAPGSGRALLLTALPPGLDEEAVLLRCLAAAGSPVCELRFCRARADGLGRAAVAVFPDAAAAERAAAALGREGGADWQAAPAPAPAGTPRGPLFVRGPGGGWELAPGTAVVRVPADLPAERRELIDLFASKVAEHGRDFESLVCDREAGNPEFAFACAGPSDPEHRYYRWRVHALLQGDTLQRWRVLPYRMHPAGPAWLPPPSPAHPAAPGAELSPEERAELFRCLRRLTPERGAVRDAMVWCLERARKAEAIAEVLCDALTQPPLATPPRVRLARLFLASDLLHNSGCSAPSASLFRAALLRRMDRVWAAAAAASRELESSRATAGEGAWLRDRAGAVLSAWARWGVCLDSDLRRWGAELARTH